MRRMLMEECGRRKGGIVHRQKRTFSDGNGCRRNELHANEKIMEGLKLGMRNEGEKQKKWEY